MPRLYFIRHGETDWNREGRLQGRTDTSLNARGRKQAAEVARHLGTLVPALTRPDMPAHLPFFASPMQRTRQTVEILRDTLGVDPAGYAPDERLREIGFGAWEGRTWPEVRARDPIGARDRDKDRWNFQPPGGESYATVMERVAAWHETVEGDACVIAHGGIARVMLVLCGGITPEAAVTVDIWQGKVLVFEDGVAHWMPGTGHA
jgi:broad specificity phosphatase PhoE